MQVETWPAASTLKENCCLLEAPNYTTGVTTRHKVSGLWTLKWSSYQNSSIKELHLYLYGFFLISCPCPPYFGPDRHLHIHVRNYGLSPSVDQTYLDLQRFITQYREQDLNHKLSSITKHNYMPPYPGWVSSHTSRLSAIGASSPFRTTPVSVSTTGTCLSPSGVSSSS